MCWPGRSVEDPVQSARAMPARFLAAHHQHHVPSAAASLTLVSSAAARVRDSVLQQRVERQGQAVPVGHDSSPGAGPSRHLPGPVALSVRARSSPRPIRPVPTWRCMSRDSRPSRRSRIRGCHFRPSAAAPPGDDPGRPRPQPCRYAARSISSSVPHLHLYLLSHSCLTSSFRSGAVFLHSSLRFFLGDSRWTFFHRRSSCCSIAVPPPSVPDQTMNISRDQRRHLRQ